MITRLHKKLWSLFFTLALLVMSGCVGSENTPQEFTDQYYDLRGLLLDQLELLDSVNPQLVKTAEIEDKTEKEVFTPDSAGWANELDAFFQTDINKPVLRDMYLIKDTVDGNLQQRIYRHLESDAAGVRYLKVSYREKLNEVRKIQALYVEKNALYESSRLLQLQFEENASELRLKGYGVDGFQKMILKDTVYYQLQAEVNY